MQHPPAPTPPIALTVAGHDPSTGAGITADLQVFAAHGLFGTSVITALTVQSTLGVPAIFPVTAGHLRDALDYLQMDLPPAGVKIGMLGSGQIALATLQYLESLPSNGERKSHIPVVFDPVLRSSSGTPMLDERGLEFLRSRLLLVVDWITPNWSELAVLTGQQVSSLEDAATAADALGERYSHLNVVVTGGDQTRPTDLVRLSGGHFHHLPGEHIETTSTHGTGCAFSSALLAQIILGKSPLLAAQTAKSYVEEALRSAPGVGHGRGPMNLLWPLTRS